MLILAGAPTELLAQKLTGNATYYGNRWHGRRTSSGEKYHKDSLTCAHRTLPFGTILRVRNPKNNKEVVVRVTDRGPFRKGAIIDLSMAAAKQIDIIRDGIARIEATPIVGPTTAPEGTIPSALPDLKLYDLRNGTLYNAHEYAMTQQQERVKHLNSTAAVKKIQPSYRVLAPQYQTAQAKNNKAKK